MNISDLPNLKMEKLQRGGTVIHLMGVRHGIRYFGHSVAGLADDEKESLKKYVLEAGLSPDNTVVAFEGKNQNAIGSWERVTSVNAKNFPWAILENSKTYKFTHRTTAKGVKRLWKGFNALTPGKKALTLSLGTVVIGLGGAVIVITTTASLFSKKFAENYAKYMTAAIQKLNPKVQNNTFRDFCQASVIRTVCDQARPKNLLVFQGVAHTQGTARFLRDDAHYCRYAKHLSGLAPKANKIFLKNLKQKEERIKLLPRRL